MQRALHFGETGNAASPRSRKTFCAVKQRVLTRAERHLLEYAVARPDRETPLDQPFHFAPFKAARFPVVALVGLHRSHVQTVVHGTGERVTEERQHRRVALRCKGGHEQPRVAGRQSYRERVAAGDWPDRRERCGREAAFPACSAALELAPRAGPHERCRRRPAARRSDRRDPARGIARCERDLGGSRASSSSKSTSVSKTRTAGPVR